MNFERLSDLVCRRSSLELIIIKMKFSTKNRDNDESISRRKKPLLGRSFVSLKILNRDAFDVWHTLDEGRAKSF